MSSFSVIPNLSGAPSSTARPYSPPQWGSGKSVYSMTCTLPAPSDFANASNLNANVATLDTVPQQPTTYFFQLVARVEHVAEQTITKHPVQIGPAIVDHAYDQPERVVLEIASSDCVASLTAGQYSSNPSLSVSMYQTFKQIKSARVPIALSTRLQQYQNMAITDIRATEDSRTPFGFRGVIYFEQIISASVDTSTVSDRPDQTGVTNEGTKGSQTLSPAEQTQINNLLKSLGPVQPLH